MVVKKPLPAWLIRVLAAWIAAAGCASARHLPIEVFTIKNELPRNNVSCLTATPGGFLWVCTSDGLVRFDGHRFRSFGPEQGLPSRAVYDFRSRRKGGFWVTTGRGVCVLAPDSKVGQTCRLVQSDRHSGEFSD